MKKNKVLLGMLVLSCIINGIACSGQKEETLEVNNSIAETEVVEQEEMSDTNMEQGTTEKEETIQEELIDEQKDQEEIKQEKNTSEESEQSEKTEDGSVEETKQLEKTEDSSIAETEKTKTRETETTSTDKKQKKEKTPELKNTYQTRYGKKYKVTCPTFRFDYSDNWSVSCEELDCEGMWQERDVLENKRGVTITFTDYASHRGLGSEGRFMSKVKVSKVADSAFVPGYPAGTDMDCSGMGEFMVAKVKTVGELFMDEDTEYTPVDGGVIYAVIPKSYKGMHEVIGRAGLYTECSFSYPALYSFIAESPDGKFTEEEEAEIIAILSSFRAW